MDNKKIAKHTLKILQIFKVCLVIFQHYALQGLNVTGNDMLQKSICD